MLVMFTVLASCEKETILTVDQTTLSYTDAGGSQTITLTANKPWTASADQSWCRVSPGSGEEATGSRITITCDANTTYDARSCALTITCAELTKTVSISQVANNGLMLSQTSYEVTKEAQQINIQVQANVKFSVEVDNGCKEWVKFNSTKGLTTSTVVLDIAENDTYDSREGKVTIKQDGGNLSSTVTIKQSQLDGLFITTPEYNLSNEKHTLTVEVSTNVEFDVKPAADWVKYVQTKGLRTKQIVLEVAENDTYDPRETIVHVKQKNGELSGTITIRQDEKYGLFVSPSEFALSDEAQTIDVEVKFNVEFDVVIPDECKEWISMVGTKGLSSKNVTFSISKNDSYGAREGNITFKQKDGPLSGTVSVSQSQNDGLFVTTPQYELSNEHHTLTVEVKANVSFEAASQNDWITIVETKGLQTSQIILDIQANDAYDSREGVVSVRQVNGSLSGTITVKQSGKNGIVLSQTEIEIDNAAQTVDVIVESNVDYDILIPDDAKSWISLVNTKSMDKKTCTFSIAKNETYANRTGSITFKQKDGALSATLAIKQAQTDCLIPEKKEYVVSSDEQVLTAQVKANISYQAIVDESSSDWMSVTQAGSLTDSTISFVIITIKQNKGEVRTGEILLKGETLSATISIKQSAEGYVEFDDANFKAYCVANFDTNLDGEISFNEALAVTEMDFFTDDIASLQGLSCFKNLTVLKCHPDADASNNQHLYKDNNYVYGKLTSLDVSQNTLLTELSCAGNQLSSLDVSKNTALSDLDCRSNQLSRLDISNNQSLVSLRCNGNQLSSLDISKNTELQYLVCAANQLTSLDVSSNTALKYLHCSENQLKSLDVSKNKELESLVCFSNQITNLDVSKNTALTTLSCSKNQLTSLDITKNTALTFLACGTNQLSSIDVSKNTKLTYLQCIKSQLTSLNVRNNPELNTLYCYTNNLTDLDVSRNTELTVLYCQNNLLTSLDVSYNTALVDLDCRNNRLTSLDVSHNRALTGLWCNNNPLLTEIWLKTGQTIEDFKYDTDVATIKYK